MRLYAAGFHGLVGIHERIYSNPGWPWMSRVYTTYVQSLFIFQLRSSHHCVKTL